MECENFHEHLNKIRELAVCPFPCTLLLEPTPRSDGKCCPNMHLIKDNHLLCKNCGQVHNYLTVDEVDFYENMHRIRNKSVNHRNYHIQNRIL